MSNKNNQLSNHILPVSSTMVGVCMTVVSVLQLIPKNNISPWADDLLAIDGLLFLGCTVLSYWSIRHEDINQKFEFAADRLFLVGMSLMAFVSFLVAFDLFIN